MMFQRNQPSLVIRLSILVLSSLAGAGCVRLRTGEPLAFPAAAPTDVRIRMQEPEHDEVVRSLALEEYVLGSVLAEADLSDLDATARQQLAQVQAILARTYAIANLGRHTNEGFDLCATTHCQVYRPPAGLPDDLVRVASTAVRATAGLFVTYDGQPINAVFHADCGGHTSDADAVWKGGSAPPYLRGEPDVLCRWRGRPPWTFEIDTTVLRQLLNDAGTGVGPHLDELVVTRVDEAGRVQRVTLEGDHRVEMRGAQLRAIVTAKFGPRSIMSTRFAVRRQGQRLVFEGRGFGHGVGLCQAGAKARSHAGHSSEAILHHYYPGTILQRLPVSRASFSQ